MMPPAIESGLEQSLADQVPDDHEVLGSVTGVDSMAVLVELHMSRHQRSEFSIDP